jgi:CheY-like chemotaxis protein
MWEITKSKTIEIGLDSTVQYRRNGDTIKCVIQYITEDFVDAIVVTADPRICAGEDILLSILPPLQRSPIKCTGRITRRSENDGLFRNCRGYLAQIFISQITRTDRKRLESVIAEKKAFINSDRRLHLDGASVFTTATYTEDLPKDIPNQRPKRSKKARKLGIYNILIVDDEVPNLNALERTLRSEYNVFSATNGEDALCIMEQADIGFIIADHRMPGMTGVELLEKTLERHPDTIRTILTAYTDEHLLMDAINRIRIHRYIRKPWKPEEMMAIVREVIENYTSFSSR